jgi:branched-chain amino acid transport system permease protein
MMRALSQAWPAAAVASVMAALALVPFIGSGYHLALSIGILQYLVLATAWAMFSGSTGYISLATVAFFGIGAYTVAVLGEVLPLPVVLAIAAAIGIAVALIVGLSTLRLSGIYFVIFSFGLAELIRQLVTWYEVNVTRSVGRYIFLDVTQEGIFWQLYALTVVVFTVGVAIHRAPLGLALRIIGEDEVVARHCGIDTTRAKLMLFAVSAMFMSLTGAIMAPRWTYIDPAIAFNPLISFQVVIMALLGGAGLLYGPLLGVVPLVILFDVIGANFPNTFSILLGVVFIVVVYGIPNGVAGLLPRPGRLALTSGPSFSGTTGAAPWSPPPLRGREQAESVAGPLTQTNPLLLRVDGLAKTFGGLRAVDGLSFDVPRGSIVGLIGPNGSGKTTALNMISGLIKPTGGSIHFAGRPVGGERPDRIVHLGVARTFQLVRVLGSLSCIDNVLAGIAFRRKPLWGMAARTQAAQCLARVGLTGRDTEPAATLTYIDQKRLELARALALEPNMLLLDEWLAGLNPTELQDGIALIAALRRDGLTILMVEHVMDAIRSLCDRCVVMNAGRKIAEGSTADVLAEPEVVRAYLGDADA